MPDPIKIIDRNGAKKILATAREWDAEIALTPWQKDFLKKQEESERTAKLTVSLAVAPNTTEFTGADAEITLTATARYDGKAVTAEATPVSANLSGVTFSAAGVGKYPYKAPATSNGKETLSFSVKLAYTDDLGTVEKNASASLTRYAPIRFLSSATTPAAAAILAAAQKFVKSTVKGDYSVTFTNGQYVWVCIPAFLTPVKFTSGGFGVPMEAPVTVPVTIGSTTVDYRCYRTTGAPQTSPMSLTIE